MGVDAALQRSGSRWVGPGSASQTDAQTVDLTMSVLIGFGDCLCSSVLSERKSLSFATLDCGLFCKADFRIFMHVYCKGNRNNVSFYFLFRLRKFT